MIVASASASAGLRPPPLWVVSDGERTVGPVSTTLLVKGVGEGRVPAECYVRAQRALIWRPVGEVREVRAYETMLYRRAQRAPVTRASALGALIDLCESTRETLGLGLELAAERTGASVGLLHLFVADKPAETRHATGAFDPDCFGRPLAAEEPTARMAGAGCIALGDPRRDPELALVGKRLGAATDVLAGVAVVPILGERGPIALMELGRTDHGFRATDAVVLREVAARVARRMDVIG